MDVSFWIIAWQFIIALMSVKAADQFRAVILVVGLSIALIAIALVTYYRRKEKRWTSK